MSLQWSSLETPHLWRWAAALLTTASSHCLLSRWGKLGALIYKRVLFLEARVLLWLLYTALSGSGKVICMTDENKCVGWPAISSLWIISFLPSWLGSLQISTSLTLSATRKKWVPGHGWREAGSRSDVTTRLEMSNIREQPSPGRAALYWIAVCLSWCP